MEQVVVGAYDPVDKGQPRAQGQDAFIPEIGFEYDPALFSGKLLLFVVTDRKASRINEKITQWYRVSRNSAWVRIGEVCINSVFSDTLPGEERFFVNRKRLPRNFLGGMCNSRGVISGLHSVDGSGGMFFRAFFRFGQTAKHIISFVPAMRETCGEDENRGQRKEEVRKGKHREENGKEASIVKALTDELALIHCFPLPR